MKGANDDVLKKVKHIVQNTVFAAYHMALETSFLADEGVSLPECPLESPIRTVLPDIPSNLQRSISSIPGFGVPIVHNAKEITDPQSRREVPDYGSSLRSSDITEMEIMKSPFSTKSLLRNPDIPRPFYNPTVEPKLYLPENSHHEEDDSATPISVQNPSLVPGEASGSACCSHFPLKESEEAVTGEHFYFEKSKQDNPNVVDDHAMLTTSMRNSEALEGYSFSVKGSIDKGQACMFSQPRGLHGCESYLQNQAPFTEEFPPSPSDHQSILVSLLTRSVWKGTVCQRSLLRIKCYRSFDKPLGQFLREYLFDQVLFKSSYLKSMRCW